MTQNSTNLKKEIQDKITFKNKYYLDDLINNNEPIILISAHYGHLERLAYIMGNLVVKTTHVARKLNNEFLNSYLQKQRAYTKLNIVDKNGAVKPLVNTLKNNGIISLIVDQNTASNAGVIIDFLGFEARQTDTPAVLSRKFNAKIVPFFINTFEDSYNIEFLEPFVCDKTNNKEQDILNCTQQQARIICDKILENPTQWFWLHKRWKNKYEYIYE